MAERLGARENSSFMAICTAPDICKTPVGPNVIPIPYMVIADLGQSENCVPNARFNGDPCKVLDQSTVPRCTGDEPGFIGGVRSGTVAGEVKPVSACSNVRAGGRSIVREFDPCTLNSGNCPGIYVTVSAPGSAIGAAGKPTADTKPPLKPTPAEERGLMEKFNTWWKQTKRELNAAAHSPGEAAVGAAKGTANTGLGIMEPTTRGGALAHAVDMEERAAISRLFGHDRYAGMLERGAPVYRQGAVNSPFPSFDMTAAEAGGDKAFTVVQSIPMVVGLGKIAGKIGTMGIKALRREARALSGVADDAAGLTAKGSAGATGKAADAAIAGKGGQLPRGKKAAAPDVDKPPTGDGVRIRRTAHEGAAFGEQKAHAKMKEMGYERIDKGGEYKPGRNGIDGVYRNPSPPPDYVVLDAKYNTATLDNTLDGRQMSDSWIRGDATGFNRLREAVGPKAAANIRTSLDAGTAQRWLMHVDESGKVTIKVLDAFGKVIKP